MGLIKKLAVLGGAAEAARRYAQKNPDKAGRFVDQAAVPRGPWKRVVTRSGVTL